jgi:hypothetical protein
VTQRYLLDTNALSILAPQTAPPRADPPNGAAFRAWVREHAGARRNARPIYRIG